MELPIPARRQLTTDLPCAGNADVNGDGVVDIGDFTIWADNFGNTAGASGSPGSSPTAVPEPSSFALLGIGGLALYAFIRRRRRTA